jgi:hypothetical protein
MAAKDPKTTAAVGGKSPSRAPTLVYRPMPLEEQDQTRARLNVAIVAAVLVLAFLVASFPAKNSDLWMHLATGREIASGRYQVGTDPFSYNSEGLTWVNHSWLYDLLIYLTYTTFGEQVGGPLLVVLKALAVVGIAVVMLQFRRPGMGASAATPQAGGLWIPAACTALAVVVLSPRLLLQPTIFTSLFLALTLLLLHKYRETRWFWLLVPLFVL